MTTPKEGAGLLERAAQLVEGWHISKGGYTELAHQIRMLAPERPADWLDGTDDAIAARGHTACEDQDPIGYLCTRPPGHAGEHRAFGDGDEVYATWSARKVVGANG